MIICLDLETTGLSEDHDHILEVGMLAIDPATFAEVASFSSTVLPEGDDWMKRMDDYVKNMHLGSGLLADIHDEGQELEDVIKQAVAFYHEHSWGERSPLMGANPDFDRRFLRAQAPALAKLFHYRNFDINSFWLLRTMVLGQDGAGKKPETKHRAIDDCRQALGNIHSHFNWMRELYGQEAAALRRQMNEAG